MHLKHATAAIWTSAALLLGGLLLTLGTDAPRPLGFRLTRGLFIATVLVEVMALTGSMRARKVFSPDDLGRRTWTLITTFLAIRLIAELRAITLVFDAVPSAIEQSPDLSFTYQVVLRYLFTVSDVVFILALVTMIRAYRSLELHFRILPRDWAYIAGIWLFPLFAAAFRENLFVLQYADDPTIATYRLVAVFVGAIIVSLCLVVRRYVVQMGGGILARIWTAVVVAGIARAGSFVALALLSGPWEVGAAFFEQLLLWIFACFWLLATLHQASMGHERQQDR